jgi:hypothetical protein
MQVILRPAYAKTGCGPVPAATITTTLLKARLLAGACATSTASKYKCAFQKSEARSIVAVTRWDSDLEAFSHKPSDGSFAPLACRPST